MTDIIAEERSSITFTDPDPAYAGPFSVSKSTEQGEFLDISLDGEAVWCLDCIAAKRLSDWLMFRLSEL